MNLAYKYCNQHGVDILESLELKITPPNQFNDPFEFTPSIITSNPVRKAKEVLKGKEHIGTLRPVVYVKERVLFDATWEQRDPKVMAFEEQMVYSKNSDWSYEEELRQLLQLVPLKRKPLNDGTPGYFMLIPPAALVSVTLGARCSAELEKKVLLALTQSNLSHVKLNRAVLDERKFALKFV